MLCLPHFRFVRRCEGVECLVPPLSPPTEKIDTASAPFSEFEEKGLGTHPIKVRWE